MLHSEVLGLDVRLEEGTLRFYDPVTGQKLLSHAEIEQALRARTPSRPNEKLKSVLDAKKQHARLPKPASLNWKPACARKVTPEHLNIRRRLCPLRACLRGW